jgi:hypothetical protein
MSRLICRFVVVARYVTRLTSALAVLLTSNLDFLTFDIVVYCMSTGQQHAF